MMVVIVLIFVLILWNKLLIKKIEQIRKSLKTKNSFGYNKISTKILKISSLSYV